MTDQAPVPGPASHVLPLSGGTLDRAESRRLDPTWLAGTLTDPRAMVVVTRDGAIPVGGAPLALVTTPLASLPPRLRDDPELVLLGLDASGHPVLAVADNGAPDPHEGQPVSLVSLRDIAADLEPADAGAAAYACALLWWLHSTRHCSACGASTAVELGGLLRRCTDRACGAQHHPRTDPCVIVLVEDDEHVLLGRRAAWPVGRFSLIAGFVSPGESLEAAVVREVREETGVAVDMTSARYQASQPWPFPASLMVGFTARARVGSAREPVAPADQELAEVRWVERRDLRRAIASAEILLPPPASIARFLLDRWLQGRLTA